jgi:hypothetical protein
MKWRQVNDELKGCGRKRWWPNFNILSQHLLGGLRKATKPSVIKAGLRAEILTWNLPNMEQEC